MFDFHFGIHFFIADIYDEVARGINTLGLNSECVGGGRIDHHPNQKKILVYGYSMVS